MNTQEWSLHDAKNKLSEVVNAAHSGTPQIVTRRGVPAAVVLSVEAFNRYQQLSEMMLPSFTEHLLNMPTDDSEFERLSVSPRKFV